MKFLLDYFFPISSIEPTPAASTAFLKQVCIVCKPKSGQEGNVGNIYACTTIGAVAARTDNTNAVQLFAAGMSKVYVLLANDLGMTAFLGDGKGSNFYTVLISDDFGDSDFNGSSTHAVKAYLAVGDLTFTAVRGGLAGNSITIALLADATAGEESIHVSGTDIVVHMEDGVSTAQNIADKINDSVAASALVTVAIAAGEASTAQAAAAEAPLAHGANAVPGTGITVGDWEGVIGVSSADETVCAEQAVVSKRAAFFTSESNGADNMCYAFGKMLSNSLNWRNQQYITMPLDDGIETLGSANTLFDDKASFVLSDDEFGNRLGLFACGGKAIVAPYIERNLQIDMQSAALSYISGNQPAYTKKQAALVEDELQKVVRSYIDREWIEAGVVTVSLVQDNFVASGQINIAEPKALWRIFGEMRQSL